MFAELNRMQMFYIEVTKGDSARAELEPINLLVSRPRVHYSDHQRCRLY